MAASQDHPHESLAQAVGAIFHRQLVAFLIIWLAVGFPVTCQLHGMMSMYEMEPHQHDSNNTAPPCALHDHTTAPSMTMLLSLITSMIPDQITCYYDVSGKTLSRSVVRWPLQLVIYLPEQPPRSA